MQRVGVTLTEVLVAIFIMGIGLLSLLVLFPLGALNMAQAIKDQRVTMAAQNAFALALLQFNSNTPSKYPLAGDPNLVTNPGTGLYAQYAPGPINLYLNPRSTFLTDNLFDLSVVNPNQTSYPIFVDPQGLRLGSQRIGYMSLGNVTHPGFARSDLSAIPYKTTSMPDPAPGLISRFLTVLDDMTFTENGIADIPATPGGQVTREGRYTYTFLFRPKPSSTPPQTGVDVWVVVYEKRSLAGPSSSLSGPADESPFSTDFGYVYDYSSGTPIPTVSITNATIHTNGVAPPIRKGTWILDASVLVDSTSGFPATVSRGVPPSVIGGYFYRVASATADPNNGNDLIVEFQTPVQNIALGGVGVVMENVAEVFKAP